MEATKIAVHPGQVLFCVVAVEPRNSGVISVTHGALVAVRRLIYPHTSSFPSGSRWSWGVLISLTKLARSRMPTPFGLVGYAGRLNDAVVYKRR